MHLSIGFIHSPPYNQSQTYVSSLRQLFLDKAITIYSFIRACGFKEILIAILLTRLIHNGTNL